MQRIGEPVRVAVVFGPGRRIRPVWFDWNRRQYRIESITYQWRECHAAAPQLHFAVCVGADLYELSYDTGSQLWTLAAADTEYR